LLGRADFRVCDMVGDLLARFWDRVAVTGEVPYLDFEE
jgi:hypothetical protein